MAYTLSDGSQWNYRQKITCDSNASYALNGGSDLTAYPMCIHIDNNARWTGGNNFWAQVSSTEGNIQFTDSGGSTVLPYDIEKWDYASTDAIVHVQIGTLGGSADTVVYVHYGHVSGGSYPKTTTYYQTTWDSNYKGVWHFPNGTTLSLIDATSNGHNLTNVGSVSASAGVIDGGTSYDGIDDKLTAVDSADWHFSTGDFSLSLWASFSNASDAAKGYLFGQREGGDDQWLFSWLGYPSPGATLAIYEQDAGVVKYSGVSNTLTINNNEFHHLGVTRSGTTFTFYDNGVAVGTFSDADTMANHASVLYVGGWNTVQFAGKIDEARISKGIARSANWYKLDYVQGNKLDDWGTVGTNFWQADAGEAPSTGGNLDRGTFRGFARGAFRGF